MLRISLLVLCLAPLFLSTGCQQTELYPNGRDSDLKPIDTLDFSTIYNRPADWDLDDVRTGLVLVENSLWDDWRNWGAYPDLNRYAREAAARGVTVVTLASPDSAAEIERRIEALGIVHPVIIDRGFRFGYHFLTPEGGIEGASLARLPAREAELSVSGSR
jgi:hypothetical protein